MCTRLGCGNWRHPEVWKLTVWKLRGLTSQDLRTEVWHPENLHTWSWQLKCDTKKARSEPQVWHPEVRHLMVRQIMVRQAPTTWEPEGRCPLSRMSKCQNVRKEGRGTHRLSGHGPLGLTYGYRIPVRTQIMWICCPCHTTRTHAYPKSRPVYERHFCFFPQRSKYQDTDLKQPWLAPLANLTIDR